MAGDLNGVSMFFHGSDEYHAAVGLRYDILRRPLGRGFHEAHLSSENESYHFGFFLGGKIIGYLMLTPEGENMKMRQVCVRQNIQATGVGSRLVKESEDFAYRTGAKNMVLHARKSAAGFYERLGYEKTSGDFEEVGIPHVEMGKAL
jgi:predicted GNAT family N-acyltransferase